MRRRWSRPILEAAVAFVAGSLGSTLAMDLLDTEAGGGRLTGPLVRMCLCGSLVLLLCAAFSFTRRTIVTVLTLAAALLCLPLFLYRVVPSSLTWLADAPASVMPSQVVTLDPLALAGLVTLGLLALIHASFRNQ